MSQQQILKILKKLGESEWISTTELVKILNLARPSITENLKRLRKENIIHSRLIRKIGLGSRELEHTLTWEGRL